MSRPLPPAVDDLSPFRAGFVPDDGTLARWVHDTFIDPDGPLHNPDHAHLSEVNIGWVWTSSQSRALGRTILGEARLITAPQQRWGRLMADWQLTQWFGSVPGALIILQAEYARICDHLQFCALVEHELYHIGQAEDEFGMPRFNRDGYPVLTMRGHDVEEFIGVVERYGAVDANVGKMIEAAQAGPRIGVAKLTSACGTCIMKGA
jgi:Putative phage metallopeptidase